LYVHHDDRSASPLHAKISQRSIPVREIALKKEAAISRPGNCSGARFPDGKLATARFHSTDVLKFLWGGLVVPWYLSTSFDFLPLLLTNIVDSELIQPQTQQPTSSRSTNAFLVEGLAAHLAAEMRRQKDDGGRNPLLFEGMFRRAGYRVVFSGFWLED
jgi:hypothetical protein